MTFKRSTNMNKQLVFKAFNFNVQILISEATGCFRTEMYIVLHKFAIAFTHHCI